MTDDPNPLGREYNRAEVAAARRLGLARTDTVWEATEPRKVLGGPIIYATGPYWPDRARAMARDWAIVANALDREWNRNAEEPPASSPAPLDVEEAELGGPAGVLGYVYTCSRCRWTATSESSMVSDRCPRCSARMFRRTPETEQ